MVRKKICAVALALMLVVSMVLCVQASTGELVTNGGFERYKADGSMLAWGGSGVTFGEDLTILEEGAHGGEKCVSIATNEQHVFISQALNNFVVGAEYTLTFYSKIQKMNGAGIAVKFEFRNYDAEGKAVSVQGGSFQENMPSEVSKDWIEQTLTFKATGSAATILLRFNGGGEVLFDDVSVVGELPEGVASKAETETEPQVEKYLKSDEQKTEKLLNGGFEIVDAGGKLLGWNPGEQWKIVTSEKHSGKNAIQVETEETQALLGQGVYNLVEGTMYTVEFWYKADEQKGSGAAVKMEFRNIDANGITTKLTDHNFQKNFKNEDNLQWEKHSFTFKAPGTTATIYFRFSGGGTAYFDDLSVIGETLLSQKKEEEVQMAAPVPGAENLISAGAFEGPDGILAYKNWEGGYVFVDDNGYEGKCIKLTTPDYGTYPWVCAVVSDIQEGAEYQVSSMLKIESAQGGAAAIKLEFYSDEVPASANHMTGVDFSKHLSGSVDWSRVFTTFKVPEGCKAVKIYFRLMAKAGTMFWDNADCYMITEAPKFTFETDQYFYYTDWVRGSATLTPYADYVPEAGGTADFAISDAAGNVVCSKLQVPVGEEARFDFSTALLTEKDTPYKISYTFHGADGAVVEEDAKEIYRCDRPTALNADGIYIKDGKPFFPVFGYHVSQSDEDYAYCRQAGINVVQHFPGTTDADAIKRQLDKLQENGLMAFLALYTGMKPAGHDDNAAASKLIIEAAKNHPATFGYMVMDEPLGNNTDINDMVKSYALIHSIDKVHPIYAVEGVGSLVKYREVAKCLDILGIDPYPYGVSDESRIIAQRVADATEAVYGKKPVYCLNQACPLGGYDPTSNGIVHATYQALFEGVEAVGFYDVRDSYKYKDGQYYHLWDRDCWEGVKYFATTAEDAFQSYVMGSNPFFAGHEETGLAWRIFIKNGKAIAVILNKEATDETVEIPLVSFDGSVKIGGFTAVADPISGLGTITGTDTLTVSLAAKQCAILEITPTTAVDFSGLQTSVFRDLVQYPWAKTAIDNVFAKGIVNRIGPGKYAPEQKITRADFAMFLIRTLNLTSDATENFADVEQTAYYAKELAVGKALGILQGVGDNQFSPYAEISRQDMMTICARGIRYAGKAMDEKADLQAFSDASLVADYARSAIEEMVQAGIVLGNADGTINPLGNTTRAEAAVIMNRILSK